jgi:hypothetical protein
MSSGNRQKIFNRVLLVSILVVVIVVTAYAFSRSTTVALPDYLNRCMPANGPFVYQSETQLVLNISGADVPVPAGIGINGSCLRPLSTVDRTGVIHIISDVDRNYTLGDFFLIWGNSGGPVYATFNQNQIFNYKADGVTHTISMDVDGSADDSFQNYVFHRNVGISTHNLIIIAITYI